MNSNISLHSDKRQKKKSIIRICRNDDGWKYRAAVSCIPPIICLLLLSSIIFMEICAATGILKIDMSMTIGKVASMLSLVIVTALLTMVLEREAIFDTAAPFTGREKECLEITDEGLKYSYYKRPYPLTLMNRLLLHGEEKCASWS